MEAWFQLQENQGDFSSEKSYPVYDLASDPGYFSAGLSPASSEESFSPNLADALESFFFSGQAPTPAKKSRSRYQGKKRQTASEREKLRMRDLTKALHHLRSYLPPSVAPAGQTLTKIEILRLTARYISFLSAQLGLSEEVLEHGRRPSGQVETPQTLSQFLGHHEAPCDATTTVQMFTPHASSRFPSNTSLEAPQYWLPQQQHHNF
ncbi:mesogenin-1-like [Corythoichthys intestinalis]|uniref:mesogenin-1-like n=1 Tax=Corythoichthys intestinalis TaxID=161448 RepID=UPI0025A4D0D8|nr:mesogenin-1-like [Corythoichthys intestinalis]